MYIFLSVLRRINGEKPFSALAGCLSSVSLSIACRIYSERKIFCYPGSDIADPAAGDAMNDGGRRKLLKLDFVCTEARAMAYKVQTKQTRLELLVLSKELRVVNPDRGLSG